MELAVNQSPSCYGGSNPSAPTLIERLLFMATWHESINVSIPWKDDDLSLEDKATAICEILKRSKWYKKIDALYESEGIDSVIDTYGEDQIHAWVEELESYIEEGELDIRLFNYMWDQMCDYADRDRVWINVW